MPVDTPDPEVRNLAGDLWGVYLPIQELDPEWLQSMVEAEQMAAVGQLAATVAQEYGIPTLSRQVFLDNHQDGTAIHYKFKEFLQVADEEGLAIAIGHPHEVTLKYLRRQIPRLERQGYRLALVSEVLAEQQATRRATEPRVIGSGPE